MPLISAYVVLVVDRHLEITCIKYAFVITVTNFIKGVLVISFSPFISEITHYRSAAVSTRIAN